MKKVNQITLIAMLLLSVCGLQVSAKDIIPYGQFLNQKWEAKGFYQSNGAEAPSSEWTTTSYDDSSWQVISGPLSSSNGLPFYSAPWSADYSTYYIRRHFSLEKVNNENSYVLYVTHDDACVIYLNGVEIYNNGSCLVAPNYNTIVLNEEFVSLLQSGDNVLAVKTIDTGAGEKFIDFGLYENDGNFNDIVARTTNVELSFVNDAVFPWICDGGYAQNGNTGNSYSKSALSFTFTTTRKSELTFDWMTNTTSNQTLSCFVDGVHFGDVNSSSYYTMRKYLDAGSHVVEFRDTISKSTATSRYARVKNIKVKEIPPLESAVLTANSEKITFTNEGEWPWTSEDGFIQNSNYGYKNTASRFSTSFTVTEPSKFAFWSSTYYYDGNNAYDYSGYQYFDFKINGERYMGRENGSGTTCLMLEPGVYTMEWCDSIYNTTSSVKTRVSNVELSSNWVDVELATAGSLGVEVLYKVNVLTDVELLKVKGNLNSTDWTNIKQMKNLIALDLSEAKFDALPDYAFDGLSYISSVKLPEGMKSIGQYAFRGTQILDIEIPSTITSIGQNAFQNTRVRSVNFKEDSQLQYIGFDAFAGCSSLQEFIMPNTVTTLGSDGNRYSSDYNAGTFYHCYSLKKIHFSDALNSIEQYMCTDCNLLEEVHLPCNLKSIRDYAFQGCSRLRRIDLPTSLERIDYEAFYNCGVDSIKLPLKLSALENYAFQNCDNLKYIELPSYIGSYNRNFYDCNAIETVVCQSATPPSISNDPFEYARAKSAITLVVPSFAVVNYKLDTYWYQFGSIVEGDDVDYWRITSELSLTNNRRMDGEPNIDLYYGGKLRVGGNAPMPTACLNYYVNESNPGMLINDCPDITTGSLCTKFSVDANKWYFLAPVHDVNLTDVTHSADASFVFRYYDGESRGTNGTGSSWKNIEGNGKLLAGQGYIFQCNASGVVSLPAESTVHGQFFNPEDVITTLNTYESTAAANKSWNYVGNPYPAYYDVYYMDFTAPITVWNGSTYKAYSIVDDDVVLRPMQSFFVQKPDEVDNIVFHKEGRQFTSSVERASYAKAYTGKNGCSRYLFNLQISNDENATDETRVVINDKAQMSYEITTDASKFLSIVNGVPQLFTIDNDGNRYAINERPLNDCTVQIGFYAPKAGFYTIKAMRADGGVILYDTILGKNVDISSGDYVFYSEAGNNTSRLVLKFDAGLTEPTAISNVITEEPTVSLKSGSIVVKGVEGTSVEVYTISGNMVHECVLSGTTKIIKMPAGTYIVKVGDRSYKTIISH